MISNYLKVTFRNILRNPSFSFINLLGLSIGIASCLLIMQYVVFEKSYDKFHSDFENIYRLRVEGKRNSGQMQFQSARNFSAAGPEVYEKLEEVISYTRIRNDEALIEYAPDNQTEVKRFVESEIMYGDTTLFQMFDFELISGHPVLSLKEPRSIMLSESMTRKYFGPDMKIEDVIGKSFLINSDMMGEFDGTITGVFADIPQNSHIKFDILFSYQTLLTENDFYHTNWAQNSIFTYLKLRPGVDVEGLELKFPALIDVYKGDYFRETKYREDFYLQRLQDIHLYSHFSGEAEVNGDGQAVYFLTIIAVFVLVMAWVNYVNLSTTKAAERAREVGIRKVSGAYRTQLMVQFLMETAILMLVSCVVAFTIVQLTMPTFEGLVGKSIGFTLWRDPIFQIGFVLVAVSGILVAGAYPAFLLSNYKPAVVLKGNFSRSKQGLSFRKILVTFQFAISVSLIAGTYVVYSQLSFMQSQDLGAKIDKTLVVIAPRTTDALETQTMDFDAFKNDLLSNPRITNVSTSSYIPGEIVWGWGGYIRRANTPPDQAGSYSRYLVDAQFADNYDLQLVAGRFFSEEIARDTTVVVLTEAAAKKLGFASAEAAIGEKIYYPLNSRMDGREIEVIGVAKDFHQRSLKHGFQPLIFEQLRYSSGYYSIKIDSENVQEEQEFVRANFDKHFAGNPYDYFFLEDYYNDAYESDQKFGQVFALFAVLAIVVASLGLFGLSSFMIMQKTKEVGIRKVLGAPIQDLLRILSADFFRAIALANILAMPIMYIVFNNWLSDYPFRIELGIWFFVLPLLIISTTSMVTIVAKTVKASLMNPAEVLRNE